MTLWLTAGIITLAGLIALLWRRLKSEHFADIDTNIEKEHRDVAEADAAVGYDYTSLFQQRPGRSADVSLNQWWNTTGYNLRWNPVPNSDTF